MTTPRVFIIRHGETEWSLNGRHTGTSDIPLTARGEQRIRATGQALVGPDRLIVPSRLAYVYVSPRRRAQRTLELLGLFPGGSGSGSHEKKGGDDGRGPHSNSCFPWPAHGEVADLVVPAGAEGGAIHESAQIEVTDAVAEWDYGEYEGVTSAEIAQKRREAGLPPWSIWRDGCPGGESPEQVTARLDGLIADLRARFHAAAIGKPKGQVTAPYDVLIVAHGHILRALAARWAGKPIGDNPSLLLEAGGVGTLSYEHHALDEPAILLGGAFMADVVERAEEEKGQAK